jgi:hypothetical protein
LRDSFVSLRSLGCCQLHGVHFIFVPFCVLYCSSISSFQSRYLAAVTERIARSAATWTGPIRNHKSPIPARPTAPAPQKDPRRLAGSTLVVLVPSGCTTLRSTPNRDVLAEHLLRDLSRELADAEPASPPAAGPTPLSPPHMPTTSALVLVDGDPASCAGGPWVVLAWAPASIANDNGCVCV